MSRRRTVRLGVVAVGVLLAGTGCAAGRHAQTAYQAPTQDGINATVRNMALRGIAVQAPQSNYYAPGSDAAMRLVLVNTGTRADALTAITTSSASGWGSFATIAEAEQAQASASSSATAPPSIPSSSVSSPGSSPSPTASSTAVPGASTSVIVPPGNRVSYGVPDAQGALLLLGTKGRLYPGTPLDVTFTFARAGTITVTIPVQLASSPGTATVPDPAGSSDAGD